MKIKGNKGGNADMQWDEYRGHRNELQKKWGRDADIIYVGWSLRLNGSFKLIAFWVSKYHPSFLRYEGEGSIV